MIVKLDYSAQYKDEIKAYKSAKYIQYPVKNDELVKDEWNEMTEEDRAQWSDYCGGDKFYYEIDDNEVLKVLSKPYEQMNDLDFEIYFKIAKEKANDEDKNEFDFFDELFENQDFMKYRKQDIQKYYFYFHNTNDKYNDFWLDGTPKSAIKSYQKIYEKIYYCLNKYYPIIYD